MKNNSINSWDPLGLNDKPKRNIGCEGFNQNSDPTKVQEALDDARAKKQRKRAKALDGILKVCKRNAKFVVPIQAFLNAFEQEFGPILPGEGAPPINPWTGEPVPQS